jgi:hypothetical protein
VSRGRGNLVASLLGRIDPTRDGTLKLFQRFVLASATAVDHQWRAPSPM